MKKFLLIMLLMCATAVAGDLDRNSTTLPDSANKSDFYALTDGYLVKADIIDNANINSAAAIAGTKISPNFGAQVVQTTGNVLAGDDLTVSGDAFIVGNLTVSGQIWGAGSQVGTSNAYRTSFDTNELNTGYGIKITHSLSQQYVSVTLYDANDLMFMPSDIEFIDSNNLDLTLSSSLSVGGTHRITVVS